MDKLYTFGTAIDLNVYALHGAVMADHYAAATVDEVRADEGNLHQVFHEIFSRMYDELQSMAGNPADAEAYVEKRRAFDALRCDLFCWEFDSYLLHRELDEDRRNRVVETSSLCVDDFELLESKVEEIAKMHRVLTDEGSAAEGYDLEYCESVLSSAIEEMREILGRRTKN